VDLRPLQIDRKPDAGGASSRPRRRSGGIGRWIVLGAVAVAAWLFWGRIGALIDRVRLPEVEVATAVAPSPLAAAAVAGTSANGYVVASKRAALSADTPGRIVELHVTEGSVVKKGFVVARLYADEYRAALARAEAELIAHAATMGRVTAEVAAAEGDVARLERGREAAEATLAERQATLELARVKRERAEKMVADDVESRQWLDDALAEHARATAAVAVARAQQAEADAAVALAQMRVAVQQAAAAEARAHEGVLAAQRDQAQATLDKTEVRAPFDGIVVLKDAEVGEVVSPNSQGGNSRGSVATMVDFASLEVQVEMPERSIAAVVVGAKARIFLDAFPGEGYDGEVTRIWPTANRSKATIEARVRFAAPDERLRPEMGARVVFVGNGAPAAAKGELPKGVFVPASAVVRIDGRSGLFRLDRDVARFVEATFGEVQGGRALATAGVAEGERVIAAPSPGLADGDRVRVKEP